MQSKKMDTINPTFWLFLATVATLYASFVMFYLEAISLPLAALINAIALYSMYSVTHDAIHAIASANVRLNGLMGRVCAFHEGMTYPIFKISHMMHHRYTNDPRMDPDWVIGRKPRALLPLWVAVRLLHDNSYMISRKLWRGKQRHLAEHLITIALQVAYFAVLASVFGIANTVVLWVIPLAIAGAAVELLVAWLVHYPQESQHRLEHTRLFKSKILQVLMFNHNLHVVHHLWPHTPWFDYPARLKNAERILNAHRRTGVGAITHETNT